MRHRTILVDFLDKFKRPQPRYNPSPRHILSKQPKPKTQLSPKNNYTHTHTHREIERENQKPERESWNRRNQREERVNIVEQRLVNLNWFSISSISLSFLSLSLFLPLALELREFLNLKYLCMYLLVFNEGVLVFIYIRNCFCWMLVFFILFGVCVSGCWLCLPVEVVAWRVVGGSFFFGLTWLLICELWVWLCVEFGNWVRGRSCSIH